ncbi:MAG: hypothetical protein AEth_00381 [Candidatus Argoarchaeum ethanivorans]|uniref:Uncharacterized protein n=1 Tax=Candidatus Argoarchaeum ethanivorans TaxID=2608793 RepID=A0A8B6SDI1_9EURY|nr:MAG: hypothetical protein AEth_00381 [Candidatus Argoarchaeum ethanivorans]
MDIFGLGGFEEQTLFRVLEIVGENWEEIIAGILGLFVSEV